MYVTNSAKGHRAADAVERLLRESDGGNAGRRVFGAAGAAASHYQDGALKGGADQSYVSAWRSACEATGEALSKWARSREDAYLVRFMDDPPQCVAYARMFAARGARAWLLRVLVAV